ncbi:hypothetical protein PanWU01x14_001730, partial [Parasponia andersonii]
REITSNPWLKLVGSDVERRFMLTMVWWLMVARDSENAGNSCVLGMMLHPSFLSFGSAIGSGAQQGYIAGQLGARLARDSGPKI